MKVSKKTRVHFSRIFNLFALIGLTVQTIIISIEFFHYFVERDAEFVIPKRLWVPDMTLCVKVWDTVPMMGSDPVLQSMKVSQILSYTVDTEDFLFAQLIRKQGYHCGIAKVNNTLISNGCNGSMIVAKSLISDNVCYTLKYNFSHGNGLHRETISNTNNVTDKFKNTFYTVILSKNLTSISSLTPVIHGTDQGPSNSYDLSQYYQRGKKNGTFVDKAYQVWYKSYAIHLLPFPYETKCRVYEKSQAECKDSCTLDYYLKNTTEYPENVFISDSSSFDDRIFGSGFQFPKQRIKSCNEKCSSKDCSLKYSTSKVRVINMGFPDDNVIISLTAPLDPQVEVRAKSAFPTFEYILYIANCLGIWFGVSFLSLNPFPIHASRKAPKKVVVPTGLYRTFREEIRRIKSQNSALFTKINSIEKSLKDIFE